jgi:hypothetical protein
MRCCCCCCCCCCCSRGTAGRRDPTARFGPRRGGPAERGATAAAWRSGLWAPVGACVLVGIGDRRRGVKLVHPLRRDTARDGPRRAEPEPGLGRRDHGRAVAAVVRLRRRRPRARVVLWRRRGPHAAALHATRGRDRCLDTTARRGQRPAAAAGGAILAADVVVAHRSRGAARWLRRDRPRRSAAAGRHVVANVLVELVAAVVFVVSVVTVDFVVVVVVAILIRVVGAIAVGVRDKRRRGPRRARGGRSGRAPSGDRLGAHGRVAEGSSVHADTARRGRGARGHGRGTRRAGRGARTAARTGGARPVGHRPRHTVLLKHGGSMRARCARPRHGSPRSGAGASAGVGARAST